MQYKQLDWHLPFECATLPEDCRTSMLMGLTPKVFTLVPVALISGLYQKPYLKTN